MTQMEICDELRALGWGPYALKTIDLDGDGRLREMEAISYPFPDDRGGVGVMVREPGDPTTMREWTFPLRGRA